MHDRTGLLENLGQLFHLERLGQEQVHATRESLLSRRRVAKTSDGDDDRGRASAFRFEAAYGAGGLEAVHDRHVDVHQDDLGLDDWRRGRICTGAFGCALVDVDRLLSVLCGAVRVARLLGEDFEEAQIDTLLMWLAKTYVATTLQGQYDTLSSTNSRDSVADPSCGSVLVRLRCDGALSGGELGTDATSPSLFWDRGRRLGRGSS